MDIPIEFTLTFILYSSNFSFPALNFNFQFKIIMYLLCFQFKAKGTLMQMVAADWLRSDTREDDLGGRPGSIVQVLFISFFFKYMSSLIFQIEI